MNRGLQALLAELDGGIRDAENANINSEELDAIRLGFSIGAARRLRTELQRLVAMDERIAGLQECLAAVRSIG